MKYIAVGANVEEDYVVIAFGGGTTVSLKESAARKLADDILRNANYMWPIKGETDEKTAE